VEYEHTQIGRWHRILYLIAIVTLMIAWSNRGQQELPVILTAIASIFVVVSLIFTTLTVRDEGEWLALRYGPIPLIHKRIRYADITAVERGRTTILHGWGIHWAPGQGWTYNLWGFDCVRITLGRKILRVGSDDVDNLLEFLRSRLS
jgi:hypothetical protein